MADVDMPDAGAAPKAKTPTKSAKGGELASAGNKKRFEVKKVHNLTSLVDIATLIVTVERSGFVGLGHRC